MLKYFIIAVILLSHICTAADNERTITGRVFNKTTGEVIPGASIRIPNTNRGTYSSSKGFFRIKIPVSTSEMKVSSLGYESRNVKIGNNDDSLFVFLDESSVKKSNITVTGDIEPKEVIKRAIEKKNENLSKLKTFKGRLYSKMNIGLNGSMFASGGGNSITIGASTGGGNTEGYQLFLLETFSDSYVNYQTKQSRSEIIQRRQTSNISPNENLMALGNFISFYDNEIDFINTKMITPLSDDALDYYNYEITEKQLYDDRYVYVIKVTPSGRLYPAFTGTIKILEGDYNLVEAVLKPSESTAITFIEDIRIKQKYTESVEKIWYPSYLEVNGKAKVDFIKGLIDIKADVTGTSIYSDVQINIPLPDSLFKDDSKKGITVAGDADSAKTEFWENNSMREITPEEEAIYHRIDSLVARDSVKTIEKQSAFNWTWFPYLDFNRVNSIMAGLTLGAFLHGFSISTTGAYSFGLKNVFWSAALSYQLKLSKNITLTPGVSAFQFIRTLSLDESYPRLMNTAFAGLFHFDYYDYMKVNGWSADIMGDHGIFEYQLGVKFEKLASLQKTTNNSAFSKKLWRSNPAIDDGDYKSIYLKGKIGDVNYFLPTDFFENELEFSTLMGLRQADENNFYSAVGKYRTSIPLFQTGYSPIKLNLIFEGGIASGGVPLQYQHRMQSSMLFFNKPGNFLSAQPAYYGGREYYAGHAMLILTDLWWRFLGLPLYEGRGLNLVLAGSYGKFFAKGETFYHETEKQHYSEIGFGLTRIPTYISNVIYLSFDARWGIGPLAKGNFGWALSVSLPF